MGFDIYGMKPKENTPKPKILNKDWVNLTKTEVVDYTIQMRRYQKENPGVYFRNNVWSWRILWDYVCNRCSDVMTKKEVFAGTTNSGLRISELTINKMVSVLQKNIDAGDHIQYEKERNEKLNAMPDVECEMCSGTGFRNDKIVQGECNVCKGKGEKRPWDVHYRFTAKNFERFVMFLEQSGGILIF